MPEIGIGADLSYALLELFASQHIGLFHRLRGDCGVSCREVRWGVTGVIPRLCRSFTIFISMGCFKVRVAVRRIVEVIVSASTFGFRNFPIFWQHAAESRFQSQIE